MKLAEFVVKHAQRSLTTDRHDVIHQDELVVFERVDFHWGSDDPDSFALHDKTDHVSSSIGGQIPPPLSPARIGQRYALVLLPPEPIAEAARPERLPLAYTVGDIDDRINELRERIAELERWRRDDFVTEATLLPSKAVGAPQ